jgi:hypothetical protein
VERDALVHVERARVQLDEAALLATERLEVPRLRLLVDDPNRELAVDPLR